MDAFQQKLTKLDTNLFQHVPSNTTNEDRKSLLALQAAIGETLQEYTYLEIGSYQGGSLQPYVVDPFCRKIFSIDPRPYSLPDVRGEHRYPDNSTARMLELLGTIRGADLRKIETFETSTEKLNAAQISERPDFCFIDGEHTDQAAALDGEFCLSVVQPDGCIAFHDANLVYNTIDTLVKELAQAERSFRAYLLPDSIFVIDMGTGRYGDTPIVQSRRQENFRAYLWGMLANDGYRREYHRPIYRILRKIRRLLPKL